MTTCGQCGLRDWIADRYGKLADDRWALTGPGQRYTFCTLACLYNWIAPKRGR